MNESVYEILASRLDAMPNGFPRTETGIELRVLEKLFTPEQAAMANVMRLRCETPEAIGGRLGLDAAETRAALAQTVADGLIRQEAGKDGPVYGLMPFVVGIYEMNLHRLDAELAALFEEYVQTAGPNNSIYERPAVHRVIPVEEAVDFALGVHPYEQASAMVGEAKSWGVRSCICREQRDLIGEGCHHPKDTCLVFSPNENAFADDPVVRPLTHDEALGVLTRSRDAGLIHTTGNYRDGHNYICNCCTCSCGILRGVVEFKLPTAIAHSDFRATVDEAICAGCGDCMARCGFGAISLPEGVAVVDAARCVGCGQCVTVCSTDALSLERRPRKDREPVPNNLVGWMLRRGMRRGRNFLDVV